jgi:(1->4)-alpha-D-glucan 1-alpha-D-glucosylmutase
LQLRRGRPDLFRRGTYLPLAVEGARAEHVCAFAQQGIFADQQQVVITVVPRLLARLASSLEGGLERTTPLLGAAVWADTRLVVEGLACRRLCNRFTGQVHDLTGGPLPLGEVLSDFPVALLTDDGGPDEWGRMEDPGRTATKWR